MDVALRDVPLPPGLIARLSQLGVDSDAELDRALQQVTVPEDLLRRLKSILEDVELDDRLRNVAVPASLVGRVKQIAADQVEGGAWGREHEEAVERPGRTAGRAPSAVVRDRRTRRVVAGVAWVVAASLLAVGSLAVSGYFTEEPSLADGSGSGDLTGGEDARPQILEGAAVPTAVPAGADIGYLGSREDTLPTSPEVIATRLRSRPSEVVERTATIWDGTGGISDPLLDAGMYALEQLAMPEFGSASASLGVVSADASRGPAPPAHVGFDWSALLRDGVNPVVSPADHPLLEAIQVPLTTGTASYQEFRRLVTKDELPDPQQVRTEDFLAAVDYGYPRPENGAIALYAAGGPSPWDPIRKRFLLLGVQARRYEAVARPPTDLTIVVDMSIDPPGVDGLAAVHEAVAREVESLRAGDRVSVVLAAQRPVSLAQGLGPQSAEELLEALDSLARLGPQPMADLAPAIETAVRQSIPDDGASRRRVVCITSNLTQIARSDEESLVRLIAEAAREGLRLDVVRLTPVDRRDGTSVALSQAGGGKVHAARDADELWAALHHVVTMQSPVAARGVSLTVHFDPRVVKSYRLLGHEARPLELGGDERGMQVDLLLDDTAAVLFELELRNSASAEVATARLRWEDPQSGREEERAQSVGAAQFAANLGEAALPLQRGTLAAMAAEVLRRVPYAPRDADLGFVLEHADTLDSRIWDEAWFVELMEAVTGAYALDSGVRNGGWSEFYGL